MERKIILCLKSQRQFQEKEWKYLFPEWNSLLQEMLELNTVSVFLQNCSSTTNNNCNFSVWVLSCMSRVLAGSGLRSGDSLRQEPVLRIIRAYNGKGYRTQALWEALAKVNASYQNTKGFCYLA